MPLLALSARRSQGTGSRPLARVKEARQGREPGCPNRGLYLTRPSISGVRCGGTTEQCSIVGHRAGEVVDA